jgi:hypothetical protein
VAERKSQMGQDPEREIPQLQYDMQQALVALRKVAEDGEVTNPIAELGELFESETVAQTCVRALQHCGYLTRVSARRWRIGAQGGVTRRQARSYYYKTGKGHSAQE